MNFKLIPRFQYYFSFKDFFNSLKNLKNYQSDKNIKEYYRTNDIFYTNFARTGLRLLLSSISKGGKLNVGLQPFTCNTVFEAVRKAGCHPVFIDINERFTLDINDLKKKINKIDILIVTHTFGIPADLEAIIDSAKNKIIIEDCAHSFLSYYKGKPTGIYGDAAIFSTGYGKFPSIGPGGYCLINNKIMYKDFLRLFKDLPTKSKFQEITNIFKNYLYSLAYREIIFKMFTHSIGKILDNKLDLIDKKSFIEAKGYRSNINTLIANFNKYFMMNQKRIKNGKYLIKKIDKKLLSKDEYLVDNSNFYIFPLLHDDRDKIVETLFKNGIESGKHFSYSIEWAKGYGYTTGTCPNSEKIASKIFTIPTHPYLTKERLNKIANITNGLL